MDKYGVINVFSNEDIKNKIKETNKLRYGHEYATQSDDIKLKIKETNIKLYGGIGYASEILNNKQKETCLKLYNKEYYTQTEESKQNFRNICIKKYGKPYVCTKRYTYNNLAFDSSWELAYYIWLTDNNIKFDYQPKVNITYEFNGIIHNYYPDFKIDNILFDIKNEHLYNKMLIENTIENAKYKCIIKNNVKLLFYENIKPYLEYISSKYGKTYLKQFMNL